MKKIELPENCNESNRAKKTVNKTLKKHKQFDTAKRRQWEEAYSFFSSVFIFHLFIHSKLVDVNFFEWHTEKMKK